MAVAYSRNGTIVRQVGELPSYDVQDANKVLAVNAQGTGLEWTSAGGGGGGSAPFECIDFTCLYENDELVLKSVTKTGPEAITLLEEGKQLCARLLVVTAGTTDIREITTYPFSYMYYSDDVYPILYFNWGEGSGGGSANGILYNGTTEEWEGPWDSTNIA